MRWSQLFAFAIIVIATAPASAQFQGGDGGVGYIDSAIVRSQVRLRVDASYDSPTPYRAEFFYPKCRCAIAGVTDPSAPGLPLPETSVDYQEFSLYAESLLLGDLVSGFVEVPFRLINPEVNDNTGGMSDVNCGVKVALLTSDGSALTAQLRTFVPTGDGARGLGTENVVLEPGILFLKRLHSGTFVEGEVRDIIPIGGTLWAGNVLRYGLGVSQQLIQTDQFSFSPVVETVAWSVLGGRVAEGVGTANEVVKDANTTIANIKVGARMNLKPSRSGGIHSLYVGYGKALTDDRWYDETIRAELRLAF